MVKLVTDTNLTASVNAAVSALVAGAPGALDTLNELATALGDDANFAATVTAALGNRLTWRGAWAPATAYVTNDVVTFNGGLYRAPNNFTSGGAFVLANWVELHAQTGTYALVTEMRARDISATSYGLSTAGTAAANATALQAADAAAVAAGAGLILPTGTFNVDGQCFDLEADGRRIEGAGAGRTVLQQVNTTATTVKVSATANAYLCVLRGLRLLGPGSGTGLGIDIGQGAGIVAGELKLDDLIVEAFGSHGIRAGWTDGLTLMNVRSIVNGGDNIRLGYNGATNHVTVLGSIFSGRTGVTPPAGTAGMRVGNVDGLTVIGSEYGYNDNGVAFDATQGPVGTNFIGCRWESNKTLDVVADATGGGIGSASWKGCVFLVTSTYPRTVCVQVKGVAPWAFDLTQFNGLTAGGFGIVAQSGAASRMAVRQCTVDAGTHILQDTSAVTWDDQVIVIGGDYSSLNPSPFSAGGGSDSTISANATIGLGICPRSAKVTAVRFMFDNSLATDASNFWTVELHRYSAGADQGIIGSFRTQTTAFTALRAVTATNGAQLTLSQNDALVLVATKTGTPAADLVRPRAVIYYQPN